MDIVQSIILGLVQGITEFLPVSSSGHLVFIPKLFGWQDQGLSFDVVVHLGTLFAVIVYFRKKIWKMFVSLRKPREFLDQESAKHRSLFFLIILSIIPAGIVGLLFGDWIEQNTREMWVIGAGLIFWGIILMLASFYSKKIPLEKKKKINWKSALFIAFAQAIALIPGTSRSGITMTAGLFSKLTKKDAAEFSFLMSIPIIALAGLLKLLEISNGGVNLSVGMFLSGFFSSMISGFLAIWLLMEIIKKWSFVPFAVYRIVVGIFILTFLL